MTRRAVIAALVVAILAGAAPGAAPVPNVPMRARTAAPDPDGAPGRRARKIVRRMRAAAAVVDAMFPAQRAVHRDPNRFKAIWTTRRAGKTITALLDWVATALQHPDSQSVFVAKKRESAKRIAWVALKRLNRQFGLCAALNKSELTITLPNGASLQLLGGDGPDLGERLLGSMLLRVYIDEAAFFLYSDLATFVDRVLVDAVSDLQGQIWLLSTPGVLTRGLFFELTARLPWKESYHGRRPQASDTCPSAARWTVHRWTTADNPHMAAIFAREVAAAVAINPKVAEDPEFIRNKLGAWVHTLGERVYYYDVLNGTNDFPGPAYQRQVGDRFVLGIDFGWDDRQAFSLCVYREDSPLLIELESLRMEHTLMPQLAELVRGYLEEYGDALQIVADPGSKDYFEEFRRSYDLPIMPAEKMGKFSWIQICNAQMAAGNVQFLRPADSPHVQEMVDLVWEIKPDGTKREKRGIHNDACDAFLYAFRWARHFLLPTTPDPQPERTREVRAAEEEAAELARMEREWLEEQPDNDWYQEAA